MKTEKSAIVLGFGPQSLDFFDNAEKICGHGAVLDADVARMSGANFAVGSPKALEQLHELLKPAAIRQETKASRSGNLSDNAVMWLATGRRGLSSETLFTFLTGYDCTGDHGHNYPHDPSDLGRCRRLLEQCPELVSCLPRVAAAGPEWAALAQRWDELCALMDEESPEWRQGNGSAPKTYALMKDIINGAQRPEAS